MEVPVINVGILTNQAILFFFNDEYVHIETGNFLIGEQRALYVNHKIIFNGKLYDELFFEPTNPNASFHLKAVTIGVDFHWERKEDLQFQGALNLIIDDERIVAINQVNIEKYLISVISSEMSATASKEFLKAHAVISRSWLLAQIEKKQEIITISDSYQTSFETANSLMKWYDREDHRLYDVCADDHCQRYQGITRASTPIVEEAIQETYGQVLSDGDIICDTRYSKCCGGATERFETCWEPMPHNYLIPVRDHTDKLLPDLTREETAEDWIRTSPPAFCNTSDKVILSQVLNNYDQETADFYRWEVVYTQMEIAELIARKSGKHMGQIKDLIPLKRGPSGRIEKLRIIGTENVFTVGKELEIRRILSESHLFSSAFVVDKEAVVDDIPGRFVLTGAGWGHGVGLCQIGAAVMGAEGYNYQEILHHYFQNAFIVRRY